MRYTVVLVPSNVPGTYVAYVPAIPGCVTQGTSIEDALAMAKDAAETMLEDMAEHNEYIPTEPDGALIGAVTVKVPALVDSAA